MSRYVVTEIEGYAELTGGRRAGLSVHVLDRLRCSRVVATWRSEDVASGGLWGRVRADSYMRDAAAKHAAKLEAEHVASL